MGKALIAAFVTLVIGVLGCALFDSMNCPEIGVVLAVTVMGALIIMAIEDKKK